MNNVIAPAVNFGSQFLYAHLLQADHISIEKHENYQKRSERNKYQIVNHLGIQTLTVPLVSGKNNQQLITEVKISYDENWQNYHLKCLQSAYRKAPYYEFYIDDITALYIPKLTYLWEFNISVMHKMLQLLKVNKDINFTETYRKDFPDSIDLRKSYEVTFTSFLKYNQVFEDRLPFIPNLSVLDCLFCLGPGSNAYLKALKF